MSQPIEQWEYTILLLTADPRKQEAFFQEYAPGQLVLEWDIRALIPQFNELGMDGWELVTMIPAAMSSNGLMFLSGRIVSPLNTQTMPNTFLCTFKRRVR